MNDTLERDGHTWTRRAERPCACCGARTFSMSRRTPTELIWERYPGTNGAHTFTSRRPHTPGHTFMVCHRCFTTRFAGDRAAVVSWEAARVWSRVVEPTSE